MNTLGRLCAAALVLPFAFILACSDDHDHAAGAPADCTAIVDACHSKDTGSGPAHDCHELGEKSGVTAKECADAKAGCLATCAAPAPADAGGG